MSRIGKVPIKIRDDVKVEWDGQCIAVSGPKGSLSQVVSNNLEIEIRDQVINITTKQDDKNSRSMWGLTRTLVYNMIHGVSQGYEKTLEIYGVGYKAEIQDGMLLLFLGFSHPIVYALPPGIMIECPKQTTIVVKGFDKQLVGEVAASIRKRRKPERYKGKGIRYFGEYINIKSGKKGK